jgi:iron complex outermembrane receptor protein
VFRLADFETGAVVKLDAGRCGGAEAGGVVELGSGAGRLKSFSWSVHSVFTPAAVNGWAGKLSSAHIERPSDLMKKFVVVSGLALAVLSGATNLVASAQETREQAAANLRPTEAKEMDTSFTQAAPFAQKLVDEALAKHPEVLLLAIHAGAPKYDIIASNFGRIGKLGDEDDLRCIRTGKDNLEVNPAGIHYEDQTPLRDQHGKIIGAIGVVFQYKKGDNRVALQKIAHDIEKEMQSQIPDAHRLFGPA